jgi:hypothetical protein
MTDGGADQPAVSGVPQPVGGPTVAGHGGPAGPYGTYPPPGVGAPRQAYPGAPPTWDAPQPWGGPPRPPAQSNGLAVTALVLAVVGVVCAFIPFAGIFLAWVFVVPALILAIIAVARRGSGRGLAITALVVAGGGGLIAVLWSAGYLFLGSFIGGIDDSSSGPYGDGSESAPYSYPSLGAPDVDASSRADELAFGEAITVVDVNNDEDVWRMTVSAPQDRTATASVAAGSVPVNGAFIAVAVELTNLSDQAIDVTNDYDYRPFPWLLTGDGGRADTTYAVSSDEMPDVTDIGVVEPGESVTYYEVFDVAASVATTGSFVVEFPTGTPVFWGPSGGVSVS